MNRGKLWLAVPILLGLWLGSVAQSEAVPYRRFHPPRPVVVPRYPVYFHRSLRAYPWRFYHPVYYPYRPIIVPYVYTYRVPYPVYVYPYTSAPVYPPALAPGSGTVLSTSRMPMVSGPLASPPPGTAIIRVRVPDVWATVRFDGVDTVTSGIERWFVTPRLREGETIRYNVEASWTRQGLRVQDQREVRVRVGDMQVVDFTRPVP